MKAHRVVCMEPGFARYPVTLEELRCSMGTVSEEAFAFGLACLTPLQHHIIMRIHGDLAAHWQVATEIGIGRSNADRRIASARSYLEECSKARQAWLDGESEKLTMFSEYTQQRLRKRGIDTLDKLLRKPNADVILRDLNPSVSVESHKFGYGYDELARRVDATVREVLDGLLHLPFSTQSLLVGAYVDAIPIKTLCEQTGRSIKAVHGSLHEACELLQAVILRRRVLNGKLNIAELPLFAIVGTSVEARCWRAGIWDTKTLLDTLQKGEFIRRLGSVPPGTANAINVRLKECGSELIVENSYSCGNTIKDLIAALKVPGLKQQRVIATLPQLTQKQNEILTCRYIAGMSYRQISEHTGVPMKTIHARRQHAITQLRRLLDS